jgi:Fic family protein
MAMQTFSDLDKHLGSVPARVVRGLGGIDNASGREVARRLPLADQLEQLVKIARVQSTEASNAIEDIKAPRKRIEALVLEKTVPQNRSEAEILGYRDVLDTIHASALDIPLSNNVLLQFHRDLYGHTPVGHAGRYKVGSNEVTETRPDGTTIVRFKPVDPGDTRLAMDELTAAYLRAARREAHHQLLLLGSYVFDFLMIHPFQDGNGRMSRLVTLLLLYHHDYRVGRYVSLEKIIDDTRATYYEALQASTPGWHEGEHDIWPWTEYLLGILTAAYKQLEDRVGMVGVRGSKTAAVKSFVRSSVSERFTLDDIRQATPAGDALIRKVLVELRDMKPPAVEALGTGRGAEWRRIHADF